MAKKGRESRRFESGRGLEIDFGDDARIYVGALGSQVLVAFKTRDGHRGAFVLDTSRALTLMEGLARAMPSTDEPTTSGHFAGLAKPT